MNNKDHLIASLEYLGLSSDEAMLYLELLRGPASHLSLARATGINRTKVYRLVDQLEQRSLLEKQIDDTGSYVAVSNVTNLSIELEDQALQLRRKQETLDDLLPQLESLQVIDLNKFVVRTFDGVAGFKQMQWHELEAKNEVLVLGNVTVEQLVGSRRWAERFRALSAENGHKTREIINVPYPTRFTENQEFMERYEARVISKKALPASTPMIIYNDTVSVYQFDKEKRVGVEIVNVAFAQTMRNVFEHYWRLSDIRYPR